jgi:hypothetical protein
VRATRWDFVTGTSAATAWTSGLALRLRARHGWPADAVRSALATTASSVAGSPTVLSEGAGRPRLDRADRPGVAYLVARGDYRAWLEGDLDGDLNTPSILLSGDRTAATRTITNLGSRTATLSAATAGFTDHTVAVSPASVRLRPGQSATFHVTVSGPDRAVPLDDGWVVWTSSDGTRARVPVALTR